MKIDQLKSYTNNLYVFSAWEVSQLELMSDSEIEKYQYDLETDGGSLSDYDHIRAFYTMKDKVMGFQKQVEIYCDI